MEFSERVLTVRLKLYLSQQQLAKEIGVSYATINRWEQGHHESSILMRHKFDEFCRQHRISFEEED